MSLPVYDDADIWMQAEDDTSLTNPDAPPFDDAYRIRSLAIEPGENKIKMDSNKFNKKMRELLPIHSLSAICPWNSDFLMYLQS